MLGQAFLWMAAAATFSHEFHLGQLKLSCTACHATVASSTKLEDNNLPAKEVCYQCHQEAVIKTPRRTLLRRFDHKKHLSMGKLSPLLIAAVKSKQYLSPAGNLVEELRASEGTACGSCHRGLERAGQTSQANFPRMADCLVCHNQVDPPFSCEFCHEKSAPLKPASHTPGFLDEHNRKDAKLDKASCAVCHGRRFTCLGCH